MSLDRSDKLGERPCAGRILELMDLRCKFMEVIEHLPEHEQVTVCESLELDPMSTLEAEKEAGIPYSEERTSKWVDDFRAALKKVGVESEPWPETKRARYRKFVDEWGPAIRENYEKKQMKKK